MFQDLIDQQLLAPNATVRFSGGEPTLSVEFEPLLRLLTEYGVRCVIYTNATKRSDAIMEALARDKVELVLGIDAASVEVYKAIKKMNYNEKVWQVVAEYCNAVLPGASNKVWANFIFCIENIHEAEHFVRRAADAGAKHVYYDFDSTRVQLEQRQRGGIMLPEETTYYVAVLRHECMKRGIEVDFAQSGLVWLTPNAPSAWSASLQACSAWSNWTSCCDQTRSRAQPRCSKTMISASPGNGDGLGRCRLALRGTVALK